MMIHCRAIDITPFLNTEAQRDSNEDVGGLIGVVVDHVGWVWCQTIYDEVWVGTTIGSDFSLKIGVLSKRISFQNAFLSTRRCVL